MYEILEHTADIGIRVKAATVEALFEEAAMGLQAVMLDASCAEPRQIVETQATGEDLASLLVNFLSEVLYWIDAKRVVIARVEVEAVAEGVARARLYAEPRDVRRHPGKVIVKGVTYHQLRIEPTPDGWLAEVFLDI